MPWLPNYAETSMNPPQKICPKCSAVVNLSAALCRNCGHGFRTQFTPPAPAQAVAPPLDRTQAVPLTPAYAPPVSRPFSTQKRRSTAFWLLTCLAPALVFFGLLMASAVREAQKNQSAPTGIVLNGSAVNLLRVGETENEMFAMLGRPAPAPVTTDTGGHLWVYDINEGGCLAARFEWNGEGYALTNALTINSPVKFRIGAE